MIVALALTSAPLSTAAQAPCADPPCTELTEQPKHLGLIATGGTFWLLAYVEGIVASAALWASVAADPTDLYRDLFGASLIPAAGPFVQVGLDHIELRRIAWGVLGTTQLVGLLLVGLGHLIPGPPREEDSTARGPRIVAAGPQGIRVEF